MTDHELVLVSALRYALEHITNAINPVCREWRREVETGNLSVEAIEQALTDIDNAGSNSKCDIVDHYGLRELMKSQIGG